MVVYLVFCRVLWWFTWFFVGFCGGLPSFCRVLLCFTWFFVGFCGGLPGFL